jgi:deferrochelatase/peroxidase EfeB
LPPEGRLTRRGFLVGAGAGAAGLAAGGAVGYALGRDEAADHSRVVPFHGAHQAGVATPVQDRLAFGAFDLVEPSAAVLASLLRDWSSAAELMTRGLPVGDVDDNLAAPPVDTGEALGLPAARLTVTFGLGPSVFRRIGLGARQPSGLEELPRFPGDALEPARSGGDLCVQACADDPVVAFHAVRNLARIGFGRASLRWTQLGFGRTSVTSSGQETLRNLQGFKDGTNNLHGDDAGQMREFVWVGDEEPRRWFRGGSYLVARRIRMLIETWDRSSLDDQQQTIGRFKSSGAPLTGEHEHDPLDFAAKAADGTPVIPLDAHVRLANPAENRGRRILRRGFSYTDGTDPVTGELDAGLFFIAFQRDLDAGFVAIQNRLAASDALREYIVHTGSAVFAVPPGARPGGFVGEGLFA